MWFGSEWGRWEQPTRAARERRRAVGKARTEVQVGGGFPWKGPSKTDACVSKEGLTSQWGPCSQPPSRQLAVDSTEPH